VSLIAPFEKINHYAEIMYELRKNNLKRKYKSPESWPGRACVDKTELVKKVLPNTITYNLQRQFKP
jgi:hypothetical protein